MVPVDEVEVREERRIEYRRRCVEMDGILLQRIVGIVDATLVTFLDKLSNYSSARAANNCPRPLSSLPTVNR